ncbi:hypothetical protein B566_EDAN006587 [Ephemera danica]|nr:hypothetical protein B566_EDAN006587 [Ephemera danica]
MDTDDITPKNIEPGISCQTDEIYSSDAACQTDITCEYLEKLDIECYNLRTELENIKSEGLKISDISRESLSKTDKKSLPTFALLMVLYNHIEMYVDSSHRNAMSKFNEILLTLMKLRLNVPLKDLGFRFNVSDRTAGRIFEKWVRVMKDRLSPLIQWPEREHLLATMPSQFKRAYGDKIIVCIIDCFEVFIIKPGNMLARAITWSYYKHHNSMKFLIGIAPQGNIIFISKAWGGRTSDKHLTENCGILNNILPGDGVMADRGFNIAESLNLSKNQLSLLETKTSRNMSNLRIHVERVIGVVRSKYAILKGILPIELLISESNESPLIDDIAISHITAGSEPDNGLVINPGACLFTLKISAQNFPISAPVDYLIQDLKHPLKAELLHAAVNDDIKGQGIERLDIINS